MCTTAFAQASYRAHDEHYADFLPGGTRAAAVEDWFDTGSVDAWRHERMYATLNPVIDLVPDARWLTIGDGRCGSDAQYLKRRGRSALATDIATGLLEVAEARGAINRFARENAESLSFENDSFDFVLCKEAYHHFPRPMIALYEMLRVARIGVILIEPYDRFASSPLPERIRNAVKNIRKPKPARFQYETVGNFIYTISRREIEKVAAGLDLGPVAFKTFNDCFVDGVGAARAEAGDPLFEKVKRELRRLDLLCKLHIRQPRMMTAVIFKSEIGSAMRQRLTRDRFELPHRPANPYAPH